MKQQDITTPKECQAIDICRLNSKELAYIKLDVDDDSGLSVSFITQPNFSCALHQIKEE